MKEQIKDESFTNHIAERITLNSVLSSRVYLADSRKFAENLDEISSDNNFAVGIDQNATFNEQYTEALNAELFTYFSPISLEELLEDSKNPNLKIKDFILAENPANPTELFYLSDKYVIKYFEGVFKVSPNTDFDMLQYVNKIHSQRKPESRLSNFQHMPKNIIEKIQKLEPRFSFGLFTSAEHFKTENGAEKERTFHIAFRGTEPDIQSVSKTDTNKNEFIKYFTEDYPNMTHHYEVIKPFVELAIKTANSSKISNLEVTGHSLGGAMVDVFLEKNRHNPDLNGINYQGYAFGNPFGISTRNKVEEFFAGDTGQKIKKTIDHLLDVDAENAVNEIRKKVRQTGKKFLQIGVNTGIAVGCTLTKVEPNDMTQLYMREISKKIFIDTPAFLTSVAVRNIFNFIKVAKQLFSSEKIVDQNFKQIESNIDSRLISIQHSGDPVPMGGSLLYEAKGTRYLVTDKNDVFVPEDYKPSLKGKVVDLLMNTLDKVTGYNIKNHKAYNYVSSCVQRVDFTRDTALAQAIRNVNHTFEMVTPQFERTNDCRNIFENIKKLRNKAYPVLHSVDKQIPA